MRVINERAYWVAWQQLQGVGPIGIKALQEHFGSLETAWKASPQALQAVAKWGELKVQNVAPQRLRCDPLEILDRFEKAFPPFWTPADPDYPPLLREIPDLPTMLFYRGKLLATWPPTVAIVGTRHPTKYGRTWARKIAQALSRAGCLIVSGLALGIDGEAHEATLEVGGLTMAVLGSSLDAVSPPTHIGLAERISRVAPLLSEYPPGTETIPANFPRRNRVVVGMSMATILIEAPERSGALISAHLACEYNRDLYVLPGNLGVPQSVGALKLIQQGARPILSIEGLLNDLGLQVVPAGQNLEIPVGLPDEEATLLQLLGAGSQSFDELVLKTGLATGELANQLLTMELKGLIAQESGLRYTRRW
jgi:DNA processing protein